MSKMVEREVPGRPIPMETRRINLTTPESINGRCEKYRNRLKGSCTPSEPVAKKNHTKDRRKIHGIYSAEPLVAWSNEIKRKYPTPGFYLKRKARCGMF